MTSCVRKRIVLALIALFPLAASIQAAPALDPNALDRPITLKLDDASMADAAAAIAEVGDIQVAAPVEPKSGITLSMDRAPIRLVLDILAKASRTKWENVGGVIAFRKPPEAAKIDFAEADIRLTPEQGVAIFLASLDPFQLFRLSAGIPLPYEELMPEQQGVLTHILSPDVVGISSSGDVVSSLPAPEQTSISFWTMPYLLIPDPDGEKPISLRLDSTPYITLRRAEK
ncbi:MAG TPA: hypothetical protein VMX94_04555 [Armatimonadota bacterium]|nr:hypothetical protein [Armatimonadota bacterium]